MGVEVAFVDLDGWDHHANENGQLQGLLPQYSNSIAAFARDSNRSSCSRDATLR